MNMKGDKNTSITWFPIVFPLFYNIPECVSGGSRRRTGHQPSPQAVVSHGPALVCTGQSELLGLCYNKSISKVHSIPICCAVQHL